MHELLLKTEFFKRLALFLVLITVASSPQAVVVEHLYEVEMPVVDQSRETRELMFERAFQQVLMRVSGTSTILGQAAIETAFKKVSTYILQFRYRELPADFIQPEQGGQVFNNILWVNFDERAIKSLLRENNLPVWGKRRPATLVWLAVRDGPSRYVLRDRDESPFKSEVMNAAKTRGLPLLWPQYDQTDRQQLSFVDVWGGFWDVIHRASQRYQVESILVGRFDWVGHSWDVRWDLVQLKHQKSWTINALDLDVLASLGVDQATDLISRSNAVTSNEGNEGEYYVDIQGVESLQRYAQLENYLRSLAPVKDVYASEVSNNRVRFRVETRGGGYEDLQRVIALGRILKPLNDVFASKDPVQADVVLAYEIR